MSRSSTLRNWAEDLYLRYAADIAASIGAEEIPSIAVHVEPHGPGAAWTDGTDVYLSKQWFAQHPDDIGGVLHEFTHAIMQAPTYDETTIWLIEGLADYIRDQLGHNAQWTQAHFEPGKATAGYQTTAHCLRYLERTHPGTVKRLAQALMDDSYSTDVFRRCTGNPLDVCVREHVARPRPSTLTRSPAGSATATRPTLKPGPRAWPLPAPG
jgi:Peptidase of plants and bacteria